MQNYAIDEFGFHLAFFILGMAGGFVRSIIRDKISLRSGAVNVTVGGIMSSYFTPLATEYWNFHSKEATFATALGIGFLAMGMFILYQKLEQWATANPTFFIAPIINTLTNWLTGLSQKLSSTPPPPPHDEHLTEPDTKP